MPEMPDLRMFFNMLLNSKPLGDSPGLGTGPSAAGRPAPGPVVPTAGGEGIRGLWGMLPGEGERVDRFNSDAPGSLVGALFNKGSFPQVVPNRSSPFPKPVTQPVPARQFASDPPGTPVVGPTGTGGGGVPGVPGGQGGGVPKSPNEGNLTPAERRAWEEYRKNNPIPTMQGPGR